MILRQCQVYIPVAQLGLYNIPLPTLPIQVFIHLFRHTFSSHLQRSRDYMTLAHFLNVVLSDTSLRRLVQCRPSTIEPDASPSILCPQEAVTHQELLKVCTVAISLLCAPYDPVPSPVTHEPVRNISFWTGIWRKQRLIKSKSWEQNHKGYWNGRELQRRNSTG